MDQATAMAYYAAYGGYMPMMMDANTAAMYNMYAAAANGVGTIDTTTLTAASVAAAAATPLSTDGGIVTVAIPVPEWTEHKHDTTGKPYWYNRKTNESVWVKPDALKTAAELADTAANWQEHTDTKTKLPYYHNIITKETRWEKPKELVARDAHNAINTSSTLVNANGTPMGGSGLSSITAIALAQKRAEQAANAERIKIAKAAQLEKEKAKRAADVNEAERLRLLAEAERQQRERIEAAKRAAEMPAPSASGSEYASEEAATRAFMDLLKEKNIGGAISWKDATPVLCLDKRWAALKTLQRKQEAFELYLEQKELDDRHDRKRRIARAQDDFMTLLKSLKLSPGVRWRDVKERIEKDLKYKMLSELLTPSSSSSSGSSTSGSDGDRLEDIFLDFMDDLEKDHREKDAARRKLDVAAFTHLLEDSELVHASAQWRDLTRDKSFTSDPRYLALMSQDRIKIFDDVVRTLANKQLERKLISKEAMKAVERKQRAAFHTLLDDKAVAGCFHCKSRWKSALLHISREQRYRDVKEQSGANCKEIFEEFCKQLSQSLKPARRVFNKMIADLKVTVTMHDTVPQLMIRLSKHQQFTELDGRQLALLFNELILKQKSNARKRGVKVELPFDTFVTMLRIVVSTMHVKPTWEAMRDQLREQASIRSRAILASSAAVQTNAGNALDELVSLFMQLSDSDAARAYQMALLPPSLFIASTPGVAAMAESKDKDKKKDTKKKEKEKEKESSSSKRDKDKKHEKKKSSRSRSPRRDNRSRKSSRERTSTRRSSRSRSTSRSRRSAATTSSSSSKRKNSRSRSRSPRRKSASSSRSHSRERTTLTPANRAAAVAASVGILSEPPSQPAAAPQLQAALAASAAAAAIDDDDNNNNGHAGGSLIGSTPMMTPSASSSSRVAPGAIKIVMSTQSLPAAPEEPVEPAPIYYSYYGAAYDPNNAVTHNYSQTAAADVEAYLAAYGSTAGSPTPAAAAATTTIPADGSFIATPSSTETVIPSAATTATESMTAMAAADGFPVTSGIIPAAINVPPHVHLSEEGINDVSMQSPTSPVATSSLPSLETSSDVMAHTSSKRKGSMSEEERAAHDKEVKKKRKKQEKEDAAKRRREKEEAERLANEEKDRLIMEKKDREKKEQDERDRVIREEKEAAKAALEAREREEREKKSSNSSSSSARGSSNGNDRREKSREASSTRRSADRRGSSRDRDRHHTSSSSSSSSSKRRDDDHRRDSDRSSRDDRRDSHKPSSGSSSSQTSSASSSSSDKHRSTSGSDRDRRDRDTDDRKSSSDRRSATTASSKEKRPSSSFASTSSRRSKPAKSVTRPHDKKCENECGAPVTVSCGECKQALCAACDDVIHRGPRRTHVRVPYTARLLPIVLTTSAIPVTSLASPVAPVTPSAAAPPSTTSSSSSAAIVTTDSSWTSTNVVDGSVARPSSSSSATDAQRTAEEIEDGELSEEDIPPSSPHATDAAVTSETAVVSPSSAAS